MLNIPLLAASFLITIRCLSVNLDSMSESGLLFSMKTVIQTMHKILSQNWCANALCPNHAVLYEPSPSNSRNSSYRVSVNSHSYTPAAVASHHQHHFKIPVTAGSTSPTSMTQPAAAGGGGGSSGDTNLFQSELASGQITPTLSHTNAPPSALQHQHSFQRHHAQPMPMHVVRTNSRNVIASSSRSDDSHTMFNSNHSAASSAGHDASSMSSSSSRSLWIPVLAKGLVHLVIFVSALIGYGIEQDSNWVIHDTTLIYILCILSIYIIILLSYISFRVRFFYLARSFKNPFGIFSALFGIAIYLFIMIATLFYKRGGYVVVVFLLLILMMSLAYRYAFKRQQRFNEEEEQVMFVVYVMKGTSFLCDCFLISVSVY